ncbi:MAG TPA: endonuclease III [Candidatus Kryptobacter bacterium]|nr:endonuclease III [Candidatus Kryptobacter bacterium]
MAKRKDPKHQKSGRTTSLLDVVASRLRDLFGVPQRKRRLPDPLELLIATVLSQNTNDVNSHKAYVNLKSKYPHFLDLAGAKPGEIVRLIKVGGIANKKSRTIINVVREIRKSFPHFDRKSLISEERNSLIDRLRELNGVGYKTASCLSLFALGDDDAFPVDTHVHRVLNRIGIVREKTPDKTYLAVRDFIPPGRGYEIHINLIRFGRKVCTAQRPKCYDCVIFDVCGWKEKCLDPPDEITSVDESKVRFMLLEKV